MNYSISVKDLKNCTDFPGLNNNDTFIVCNGKRVSAKHSDIRELAARDAMFDALSRMSEEHHAIEPITIQMDLASAIESRDYGMVGLGAKDYQINCRMATQECAHGRCGVLVWWQDDADAPLKMSLLAYIKEFITKMKELFKN